MSNYFSRLRLIALFGAVLADGSTSRAQQYLYTNDNIASANSTTALSVGASGALKVLHTYPTGGRGSGGSSYYASQPIAWTQVSANRCLFVSNGGSSSIAAFQINLKNGKLTTAQGSPFSDGESGEQTFGISLATGKGQLLFAANSRSSSISVMRISANCGLSMTSVVDLDYSPVALKVTPNGNYLIASYLDPVDSFSIDYSDGEISEIGPFPSQGEAAGVDIRCDGSRVFFGDANANTEVEVFAIGGNGQLNEVENFTDQDGQNSNNVLVSADQNKLFVTNNQSNQITVLSVSRFGRLTFDSITSLNDPGEEALGLATNKAGNLLFVSEVNDPESIGVLAIVGTRLVEVPNSPFGVINNDRALGGLIAVPTYSCP